MRFFIFSDNSKIIISVGMAMYLFANNTLASSGAMKCDNPRREYVVKYDDELGSFVLQAEEGKTRYKVKSVSIESKGAVFKGETAKGGPTFQAFTSGRKRVEFFENGQRIQTDFCE
jgi:hypothetical protein